MTIVRCTKCKIVVLDGMEDGEKKVQCNECGRRYRITLQDNKVASFAKLGPEGEEELQVEEDVAELDTVIFERKDKR